MGPSAEAKAKITGRAPRCPQCGSIDIRPSAAKLIDVVANAFDRTPFRCRSCRTRFYVKREERAAWEPQA